MEKLAQVKRHQWSRDQLATLLSAYQEHSAEAGGSFNLKEFLLTLRSHFPFFEELDDDHFYERLKRTLYRQLLKSSTPWRHSKKEKLQAYTLSPDLKATVLALEQLGVALATDGAVLLIFPMEAMTNSPTDGYFVKDIPAAITHLKKLQQVTPEQYESVKTTAGQVITLLQRFVEQWKQQPEEERTYKTNRKPLGSEYEIQQDPTNPKKFTVTKNDGTSYECDTEEHTCTCPAGEAGRTCKHLAHVLFHQ